MNKENSMTQKNDQTTAHDVVAYLHICRKRPDLKELRFEKHAQDLSAKGYKAHPLAFAEPATPVAAQAQPISEGKFERMFRAACEALGEINEKLGLDPDDGGAEPIIAAIEELQARAGSVQTVSGAAQVQRPKVTFEMVRRAEQVLVRGNGPNYRRLVADAIEAALDVAQKDGQLSARQPISGADGLLCAVRELTGHLSDVLTDDAWGLINTEKWNAVTAFIGTAAQPQPSGNAGELPQAVLPPRPEPEITGDTSNTGLDLYSGAQMLQYGRACADVQRKADRAALAQQASGRDREEQPSIFNPITPYGLLIRALRRVADTTLMEMSEGTGYSSAFLSSVEFGREVASNVLIENTRDFFASKGIHLSAELLSRAAAKVQT